MLKRQRLFLSLALSALLGLMANECRAETITMTITANGSTATITNTPFPTGTPASLVSPPSSANRLEINTGNLNTALAGLGSHYAFTELGATSNWSGNSVSGAFLKLGGTIVLTAGTTPDATPLTIHVTEDGFLQPIGPGGVLLVTANANYASAPGSNQTGNTGSLNATNLTTPNLPSDATGNNNPNTSASTGIGTVATGFTLDTGVTLSLGFDALSAAANTFAVTATVTTAVPEPPSVVMFLTGIPLPLAVVGLLLRRRRGAP